MPIERGLSQTAELRVQITSDDPKQIVDALAKLNAELGHSNTNVDRLEKRLVQMGRAGRNAGREASTAGKSVGDTAAQASAQWTKLEGQINEAQAAYRAFRQDQALGLRGISANAGLDDFLARARMTRTQLQAFRAGNSGDLIGDLDAEKRRLEEYTAALPRLRYALYDVSTTALITATSIAAVGTAAIIAGARYESAFTNVERTLEPGTASVAGMRRELIELAREVPKSFEDLASIATLGNQLGVPADQLMRFTELVSKFSTVSGLTVEASAQAFGRLSNILGVPIEQMDRVASAIELVGVSSASTDAEIISLAERLGATATRAGFTADQVVGLSGALGSLGVAPERAQGVFETYFNSLNESLAEGGDKLAAFSLITQTTTEDLNRMVRDGRGFEVFQRFITGLQGADTAQLTGALRAVGLEGLRANEVIGRISQRMPLLQSSFETAARGARENSELNRQYAKFLDDLASKWQLFINALQGFGAAVGSQVGPAVGELLDRASQLLNTLADFASSPFGGFVTQAVGVVATLAAGLFTVAGGAALFGASLFALRTALAELSLTTVISRLKGMIGALTGVSTASWAAAGGVARLGLALRILGRITVIGALIGGASQVIFDFGGTMRWAADMSVAFADAVVWSVGAAYDALAGLASLVPFVGSELSKATQALGGLATQTARIGLDAALSEFDKWANSLPDTDKDLNDLAGSQGDLNQAFSDGVGSLDEFGNAAEDATAKVRTLVDYGTDLGSVMQRAFDIRYGGQQGLDAVATGWQQIATSAEDAREAAAEYRRQLADLSADKAIKQYWLSVAEMYGDELRAQKLRADLAKISADQADAQRNLVKAQDQASMSLTGNSAAAIQNRSSLLGLVTNYQSYIQSLAASGMNQEQLRLRTAQLQQEFIQQATQMGYNRHEVDQYAIAFNGMTTAINGVPRDITVTAHTDPAMQALNEFIAQAQAQMASAGTSLGNSLGNSLGAGITNGVNSAVTQARNQMWMLAEEPWRRPSAPGSRARTGGGSFAEGGWTGPGAKYQPKGFVHGDEYVFSKKATRNLGVDNLAYLHKLGRSGRGYAGGGLVGGPARSAPGGGGFGGGTTELGINTLHALAQMLGLTVNLDSREIGRAVGNDQRRNTALGGG